LTLRHCSKLADKGRKHRKASRKKRLYSFGVYVDYSLEQGEARHPAQTSQCTLAGAGKRVSATCGSGYLTVAGRGQG